MWNTVIIPHSTILHSAIRPLVFWFMDTFKFLAKEWCLPLIRNSVILKNLTKNAELLKMPNYMIFGALKWCSTVGVPWLNFLFDCLCTWSRFFSLVPFTTFVNNYFSNSSSILSWKKLMITKLIVFYLKSKTIRKRQSDRATPKCTQYTGEWNIYVSDFNKLPYSLRWQGD